MHTDDKCYICLRPVPKSLFLKHLHFVLTMIHFLISQSQDAVERLEQLLQEIHEKLQTPAETEDADPEWLVGTEAEKQQKVQNSLSHKEKEK